ncbi:zinc finger protein 765 [Homo sapiens]|uniref:Zinc finger protein 765 n=1 Tax=Homo sapiens TaxID=9606 RepID=E9PDE6_HUMAN|nr:zinc finger protein 765 [Homo sapiens]KAI4044591.1 zinc finger protein 765 [Homo sapiens]
MALPQSCQGSVHWQHLPPECLPGHHHQPQELRWAELKGNAPKHAGSCVFLSWLLPGQYHCSHARDRQVEQQKYHEDKRSGILFCC